MYLPKKVRTVEEHLEIIESLLVGIILKRKPNVRELSKIMGISSDKITEMYPKRRAESEEMEVPQGAGDTNDQQTGDEASSRKEA